jgi:hypothetical protein
MKTDARRGAFRPKQGRSAPHAMAGREALQELGRKALYAASTFGLRASAALGTR